MVFPVTCLFHFVVVECRSLYVFWGSFKSLAEKIAMAAEMRRELGDEYVQDWSEAICVRNQTLHEKVECIHNGVHEAMWTLHVDTDMVQDCYRQGEPGFSFIGVLTISATAACGLYLLSAIFQLLRSKAQDWTDGEYLYFTWSLFHTSIHRAFAVGLVGYTVIAIGAVFFEACMHDGVDDLFLSPDQLAKLTFTDAASLIFSAGAFLSLHDPAFHWNDPRLRNAKFNRPMADIVKSTNDGYGQKIAHAVLRARLGEPEELQELCGDQWDHPLRDLGKDDWKFVHYTEMAATPLTQR